MKLDGVIKGLHHVTATVNDAQEDYDFYTKLLGLRLVKETVNFDNEKVYHFYYGDKFGTPSTVFTTFPYGKEGVKKGVIGHGQVYQTSFSVPEGALPYWRRRLEEHNVDIAVVQRFGQEVVEFEDPSGLKLDIVEARNDHREEVWVNGDIEKNKGIRGIHNVTLLIKDITKTLPFINAFGYTVKQTEDDLTLLEAGEGGPGNTLIIKADPNAIEGENGLGTVHHVAHRVQNVEVSRNIKKYLEEDHGIPVSEIKDRKYFKSIYFRIPGGVLFEVATEDPGFLVDETAAELGSELKLPDWQEKRREQILAELESFKR